MAEVAERGKVQPLGAEVEDRHLVAGETLRGLEDPDGLEPDPADDPPALAALTGPGPTGTAR